MKICNWFKKKKQVIISEDLKKDIPIEIKVPIPATVKFKVVTHRERVNVGRVEIKYHTNDGHVYQEELKGSIKFEEARVNINTGEIIYKNSPNFELFEKHPYKIMRKNTITALSTVSNISYDPIIRDKINFSKFMQPGMNNLIIKIPMHNIKKIEAIEYSEFINVEYNEIKPL